jgi:hypothetical protein
LNTVGISVIWNKTISKSIDSNIFTSIEEKTRKYKMYILVLAVIYWLIIEIKPKKTLGDEKQIFYNFIWYGEICITRTV